MCFSIFFQIVSMHPMSTNKGKQSRNNAFLLIPCCKYCFFFFFWKSAMCSLHQYGYYTHSNMGKHPIFFCSVTNTIHANVVDINGIFSRSLSLFLFVPLSSLQTTDREKRTNANFKYFSRGWLITQLSLNYVRGITSNMSFQ